MASQINERPVHILHGKEAYRFKIQDDATLYELSKYVQETHLSHLKLENIRFGNTDLNQFHWRVDKEELSLKRRMHEELFEHRKFTHKEAPKISKIFKEAINHVKVVLPIIIEIKYLP